MSIQTLRTIYMPFIALFAAVAISQALEIPRLLSLLSEMQKSAQDQGRLVWMAKEAGKLKTQMPNMPQSSAEDFEKEAEQHVSTMSKRVTLLEIEVQNKQSILDTSVAALIGAIATAVVSETREQIKKRLQKRERKV